MYSSIFSFLSRASFSFLKPTGKDTTLSSSPHTYP
nr:MAG TPA: hypothetical protein [Caudoviricetes sp.]